VRSHQPRLFPRGKNQRPGRHFQKIGKPLHELLLSQALRHPKLKRSPYAVMRRGLRADTIDLPPESMWQKIDVACLCQVLRTHHEKIAFVRQMEYRHHLPAQ